jgi:hypothetical protein
MDQHIKSDVQVGWILCVGGLGPVISPPRISPTRGRLAEPLLAFWPSLWQDYACAVSRQWAPRQSQAPYGCSECQVGRTGGPRPALLQPLEAHGLVGWTAFQGYIQELARRFPALLHLASKASRLTPAKNAPRLFPPGKINEIYTILRRAPTP